MVDSRAGPDERTSERRWAEVRGRMEAASEALSRQGSVAWRTTPGGTRVASIRFVEAIDGRRVQRAIYVGANVDLVERARDLIRQYRERERWAREAEDAARFVAACSAFLRRAGDAAEGVGTRRGGLSGARPPRRGTRRGARDRRIREE